MLSATARLIISIAVSMVALVLFVALFGIAIYDVWKPGSTPSDTFVSLATAVAGVVAAIVAMALAVPLPSGADSLARSNDPQMFITRLGNVIGGTPDPKRWKNALALLYVGSYIVVGVAAIITYLHDEKAALVKTDALTFFGVMLAVVKSFLTTN